MTLDPAGKRLLLANPRGFCAGVTRAITAVEDALERFGPPIYVRRPVVHNRRVVDRLAALGAVFVQELDEVPPGSVTILSAHGVAPAILDQAAGRQLRVLDTTCPLVARIHRQVREYHRDGRTVLLVGHRGHPEIVGTLGQLPRDAIVVVQSRAEVEALDFPADAPLAYAVQTTFSLQEAGEIVDAIRARFHDLTEPRASDICYATTNRQRAIQEIAAVADHVIVVGDELSSNARRLVEVAKDAGCSNATLVNNASRINPLSLSSFQTIGLTAAASSPAEAIDEVREALERLGFRAEEVEGKVETTRFRSVPLEPMDLRSRL